MPYRFGNFRVDPQREELWHGDNAVALNRRAVRLLVKLIERHGEVVPKDELLSAVWPQRGATMNNLSQHIFMLRNALGDSGSHRYVLTVPGIGYQFVAPLERGEAEGAHRVMARHFCDVARDFLQRRTHSSLLRAVALYNDALANDPRSPNALAGRALCRLLLAEYFYETPREMLELAEQDALRTLDADRSNATALVVLGRAASQLRYHWAEGETLLLDAFRAQPEYLWGHVHLIDHYAARGDLARARQALAHARSLRLRDDAFPRLPLLQGAIHYFDRAYDAACAELRPLLDAYPGYGLARFFLAKTLIASGALDEGLGHAEGAARAQIDPLAPGQPDVRRRALALCVYAQAARKDRDGLRAAAAELDVFTVDVPQSSFCAAILALAYNRAPQALRALENAIANRESFSWYVAVDPLFEPLHKLAGWRTVLRAMNVATS